MSIGMCTWLLNHFCLVFVAQSVKLLSSQNEYKWTCVLQNEQKDSPRCLFPGKVIPQFKKQKQNLWVMKLEFGRKPE